MKAYAGIGSRSTPFEILGTMTLIAGHLSRDGWTLRSGHADGADFAFESGASHARCEIYLPWQTFNDDFIGGPPPRLTEPQPEAFEMARQHHPSWDRLNQGGQKLHARNVHQILGPDVTAPVLSRFVICWTKDGLGGGGTGQALRIAQHYDVPIFDLAKTGTIKRIEKGLFA